MSVSPERRGGAPSGLRVKRGQWGGEKKGNFPKLLLLPPQGPQRLRLLLLKILIECPALPCWEVLPSLPQSCDISTPILVFERSLLGPYALPLSLTLSLASEILCPESTGRECPC